MNNFGRNIVLTIWIFHDITPLLFDSVKSDRGKRGAVLKVTDPSNCLTFICGWNHKVRTIPIVVFIPIGDLIRSLIIKRTEDV